MRWCVGNGNIAQRFVVFFLHLNLFALFHFILFMQHFASILNLIEKACVILWFISRLVLSCVQ